MLNYSLNWLISLHQFCLYYQITVLYTLFELPFDEGTIITPDIAYGCETWPSVLTDEERLKVIENGVLRKIF
jgi:hypothetical protein